MQRILCVQGLREGRIGVDGHQPVSQAAKMPDGCIGRHDDGWRCDARGRGFQIPIALALHRKQRRIFMQRDIGLQGISQTSDQRRRVQHITFFSV